MDMINKNEVKKFLTILELQHLTMWNPFRRPYIKRAITSIRRELDSLESENVNLEYLKVYVADMLCCRTARESWAVWKVQWGCEVLSYLYLLGESESEESEQSRE